MLYQMMRLIIEEILALSKDQLVYCFMCEMVKLIL